MSYVGKEMCEEALRLIEIEIEEHMRHLNALYIRKDEWESRLQTIGAKIRRGRTAMKGVPTTELGAKIRRAYSNILYRVSTSHPNFEGEPRRNEFESPYDFYVWSLEQDITSRSRLNLKDKEGNYSETNCEWS